MTAPLVGIFAAFAFSAVVQAQGYASDGYKRGFPDCASGPLTNTTVCDVSQDPLTRATALISLLTVQEKLNQTGSESPGVPRLGLPAYIWWNEALHGIASSPGVNFSDAGDYSYATSFPQPILMGAAFDDDLIREVATVVSTEARAFNNDQRAGLDFWTPNINPFKDPRWGRGQETPGEDPYHLSSYVHALIDGLQGGFDPKIKRVVATCKHFAAYDLENWNGNFRYQFDAQVNSQDLKEYYMPPFQSCARDSNVGAFMCSYNALNGVPTCADDYLLKDILREHWGWTNEQQWVTSDCDSVQNIFLPHNYSQTRPGAAAAAFNAGTDIDCGTYYQHHLPEALAQGLITEQRLDEALIRQYSSLIRLGYFDGPTAPYRNLTFADVNLPSSQALALRAAVEGIVLLKNDGMLPLQITNGTSLALIGDWANATEDMQGNYFGPAPYLRSPLIAAENLGASVNYARGPGGNGDPTTDGWLPVWRAVSNSDIIIYAGGINIDVEKEDDDRVAIGWSGPQLDIIGELAALGKPMIVLQMGGGQIDSTPVKDNANISALLWGGIPGQDGGTALFDIITGKTAPAGRLPTTQYPTRYTQQIPMTSMALRPNGSLPGRTYKWYDEAVFEFGFGMHYTNFSAEVPSTLSPTYDIQSLVGNCSEKYQDRCPFETIQVQVNNDGDIASDYVTLGFIAGEFGPQPYPRKSLVNYQRLFGIQPGQSQTAQLNLTLASLARVDDLGNTVLYPGNFSLLIDTQPLTSVNFTLTGEEYMLDKWPQPP
ncbi:Periplasmic beta-glucosidase [Sphaceloma murrayae]|uniref:xylan 1,4-beta-xylosidase n=1 Tax=Sphaceloma murrayae TaxID=2082308 RepID=A0A2K1QUD1_9PEZI|nr:Periplasmic beta-glucosidase [Sphaceloma murrayae]